METGNKVVASGLVVAGVLEAARRACPIPNASPSQAVRYWLAIGAGQTPEQAAAATTDIRLRGRRPAHQTA
jgi:hypothetical protein